MTQKTIVHLLRHGEVDNPRGVLYGRLPGYHLSERGRGMALAASDFFAQRSVVSVFASPLERAVETATPVAERLGLPVVTDGRLIESANQFEGQSHALRNPANWRYLLNPFEPSWGEPYPEVVARMMAMVVVARQAAAGREAVCVSHQMPIWVTRLHVEGRHYWHNPARRECALGSVTSFRFEDAAITGVSYAVPTPRMIPDIDAAQ